jgi:WD40 repeat protein
LHIFDVDKRRYVFEENTEDVDCIAVSPDGTRVATTTTRSQFGEGVVHIWDVHSSWGRPLPKKPASADFTSRSAVCLLTINSSKDTVLCVHVNGEAAVYKHATGRRLRRIQNLWGHREPDSITASPDGELLAIANDLEVQQIDLRTGEDRWMELPEALEESQSDPIESLEYSSDSQQLLARHESGLVFAWDARTRALLTEGSFRSYRPQPGDRQVRLHPTPEPCPFFTIGDNCSWLIVQEVEVTELDADGDPVWRQIARTEWQHDRPVTAAAATLDGEVVFGDDQGQVVFLRRRRGVPFEPQLVR